MDTLAINFICSAIALLGGKEDLITIVKELNTNKNFDENICKLVDWNRNRINYLIDKKIEANESLFLAERDYMENNCSIIETNDSLIIDEGKKKRIIRKYF